MTRDITKKADLYPEMNKIIFLYGAGLSYNFNGGWVVGGVLAN